MPAIRTFLPRPLAIAAVLACAVAAHAQTRQNYDLPAQPLGSALARIAAGSGQQLSIDADLVRGRSAPAIHGSYTAEQAARAALAGSGLELVHTEASRWALRPVPPSHAAAQPAAAQASLPEVRVTAAALRDSSTTEGTGSYTSDLVTIGKGEQSLREIAQSVSVITQQRIQDQSLSDIKQALQNAPGVSMIANDPGGQFYSRGFFIESYQFDGVPLERQLYARGSAFNSSLAIHDRVEIMRGSQGLLEGAGNPSGTVNLVRKRPTPQRQFVLTARLGSWEQRGVQADLSSPLNASGTIRGRVVLDYDSTNSFREHYDSRERTAYGALDIDLGSATTLGLGFSRERPAGSLDWTGLPNYGDGSMPAYARSTNLSTPWSRADKTQDSWYLDLAHHFSNDWKFNAALVRVREANELKYLLRTGRLGPPNTMRSDAYYFDMLSRQIGGDAYLSGNTQLLGRKLAITAGANFSHLRSTDIWGWKRNLESLSGSYDQDSTAAEPSGADILAANRMNDGYRSDKKGIYASARYELTQPLSLVLGARLSWFDQTYVSDGAWGYSESTAKASRKFTPFAGLIYQLDGQWSVYGSHADIFKPQTQRNASGHFLQPVTGKTWELGLKGQLAGGRANASFALFRTEQKNVAYQDDSVPEGVASTLCGGTCYRASSLMRSQGLEAELSGEVARGLQLASSYTYTHTRYRSADVPSVGYDISANTGVPKHMARVWASYRLPGAWSRLSVGGGIRVQSRSSDFAYYGRTQGGYAVLDARLAWQATKELSLALNIGNLADRRYFRSISYDHNYYGTPRSFLLSMQYRM